MDGWKDDFIYPEPSLLVGCKPPPIRLDVDSHFVLVVNQRRRGLGKSNHPSIHQSIYAVLPFMTFVIFALFFARWIVRAFLRLIYSLLCPHE